MASLTGYMPASGMPENRLQEWYATRRLGDYGFVPTNAPILSGAHVNQGFFDCLDMVDETRLAYMIAELGLYSLQDLPDLRTMFAGVGREKPLREAQHMRLSRQ